MKIECSCGHLIWDADDLPNKAHIIADQNWLPLLEDIDRVVESKCETPADREAACMRIRTLIVKASKPAYACTTCGRLYLDDANGKLIAYTPTEKAPPPPRPFSR